MITIKAANRMNPLELRIAKLEAASQPMGGLCPECHVFGLESYVPPTAFGGKRLPVMRCRFCSFAEEKMGG